MHTVVSARLTHPAAAGVDRSCCTRAQRFRKAVTKPSRLVAQPIGKSRQALHPAELAARTGRGDDGRGNGLVVATGRGRDEAELLSFEDGRLRGAYVPGQQRVAEIQFLAGLQPLADAAQPQFRSGICVLASDSAGIVHHTIAADLVLPGGLYAFEPATGASTRFIVEAVDGQVRLGSANLPRPVVQSIAVLGLKRLLVSEGGGQFLLVTLP